MSFIFCFNENNRYILLMNNFKYFRGIKPIMWVSHRSKGFVDEQNIVHFDDPEYVMSVDTANLDRVDATVFTMKYFYPTGILVNSNNPLIFVNTP